MRRLALVLPQFRRRQTTRRRVPSGLLALAAEAGRVAGVRVQIVDAESAAWDAEEAARYVTSLRPDAVGVSICSPSVVSGLEFMRALRRDMPDVPMIVGGKHVTNNWVSAALDCVEADALVRGEGESAILTLAQALAQGANRGEVASLLAALPNVGTRGAPSSPGLPRPVDLSRALPWPFDALLHSLDFYKGDRMLVEFSRGCPGRCAYCLASRERTHLSFRPVSQVVQTMVSLRARGFTSFFFTDDDLAASPVNVRVLCEAIDRADLGIEFDANVRPDSLVRCAGLASLLRQAGCRCLWLGIETGSPKILSSYNKRFDSETCERAVEVASAAAAVVRTNWIVGAPLESEQTVRDSVDLALRMRRLGPHIPHVSFLVPYPGTKICEDAIARGLLTRSSLQSMADATHDGPVMPSQFLSKDRLTALFREFHAACYDEIFFHRAPAVAVAEAVMVLRSAGLTDLIPEGIE